MTRRPELTDLGRRERQIMDVVYRLGRASVSEVLDGLADPPSYSTVRAMLGKLQHKGYLTHEPDGPRYVYMPAVPTEKARAGAMEHLVDTFFDGSVEQAVLALVQMSDTEIPRDRLELLADRIRQAREEGK
ncbi:MAG TPA: BlaI/MecI/CopY family transcriptional regulator [Gemmatimonadales bacterium]